MNVYRQQIDDLAEQDRTFSGDSYWLRFKATSDGTDNTSPVDIGNFDFKFVLADFGGTQQFEKTTTGGGITIVRASDGLFQVKIDPGDTSGLEGEYQWEVEATSKSGDVQTIARGKWNITGDLIQ